MLICMYNVSILHLTLWNLQRSVGLPPQSLGVSFVWDRKDWEFMLWCHLEGTTSVAGTDLLFLYWGCGTWMSCWKSGSMVRINGVFHLLINGVYWGYNPLILTIDPNFQRDIQVVDPYLMPEIMSRGTNDSQTCLRIFIFSDWCQIMFGVCSGLSLFMISWSIRKNTCCWFGVELWKRTPIHQSKKPRRIPCQWQVKVNSQTPDRLIVYRR